MTPLGTSIPWCLGNGYRYQQMSQVYCQGDNPTNFIIIWGRVPDVVGDNNRGDANILEQGLLLDHSRVLCNQYRLYSALLFNYYQHLVPNPSVLVLAVGAKYWNKLGSRWPMPKKENNRSFLLFLAQTFAPPVCSNTLPLPRVL